MLYLKNVTYNLDVAKIFGVCSAIFISYFYYEHDRQVLEGKMKYENAVIIGRQEIYDCTGLEDDKQEEIEKALVDCGLLSIKQVKNKTNYHYYIMDSKILDRIMSSNSPEEALVSEKTKAFIKKPRVEPKSKRQTYIENLKKSIKEDDSLLRQYYCDWIDAVYANPKGFLSVSGISICQQELNSYTSNIDTKIDLLKIAIKGGWRDLTWAINQYEKNNSNKDNSNFVSYSDIKSDGNDIVDEAF